MIDYLILIEGNSEHVKNIRCILLMFEAMSGLKINLHKSKIMGVGSTPVEHLAEIMGWQVSTLPSTYFGLPLGETYISKKIWDPVIERMEKCLSTWKGRYLSKGRKLTLIKSVLTSVPLYTFSLFAAPCSVVKHLEANRRCLLWSSFDGTSRYPLISWKRICQPMENGGLGVRSIKTMNKALMAKWLWNFAKEKNSLWRHLIATKYGVQLLGWCSKLSDKPYGAGVCKGVLKEFSWFKDMVSFKVGRGNTVMFWKDNWCGGVKLAEAHLMLFTLAQRKDGLVLDHLVTKSHQDHGIYFSRDL